MPRKAPKNQPARRAKVDATAPIGPGAPPPVPIAGGFAILPAFEVKATVEDPQVGQISVQFATEVVDQRRAVVRRVTVETERPTGVGYNVLRSVPIRELLEVACSNMLMKIDFAGESGFSLSPIDDDDPKAMEAIRTLVGWRER